MFLPQYKKVKPLTIKTYQTLGIDKNKEHYQMKLKRKFKYSQKIKNLKKYQTKLKKKLNLKV